jgi:hypothetical protein
LSRVDLTVMKKRLFWLREVSHWISSRFPVLWVPNQSSIWHGFYCWTYLNAFGFIHCFLGWFFFSDHFFLAVDISWLSFFLDFTNVGLWHQYL